MIGKLEPEEYEDTLVNQIARAINKLGWEPGDEIDVEIGGTSVSGIDVGEEYNKKWQSPLGTRKYNKDAFILVKNLSRTPFEPSTPNPDLKQQHEYTGDK